MDGTVLVADDDRTIRTVLTSVDKSGLQSPCSFKPNNINEMVSEGKGDTITDVMMPDGNGLEMLPKLPLIAPVARIVISAQNTIMTAIQAADAKAFDYLPKPFDLPDLMKRVAKARAKKSFSLPTREKENVPDSNMIYRSLENQRLCRCL